MSQPLSQLMRKTTVAVRNNWKVCVCTKCMWSWGGEAQGQMTDRGEEWKNSDISTGKQTKKDTEKLTNPIPNNSNKLLSGRKLLLISIF